MVVILYLVVSVGSWFPLDLRLRLVWIWREPDYGEDNMLFPCVLSPRVRPFQIILVVQFRNHVHR